MMKSHIKELLMGDHPSYKITVVLAMSTFRPVGSWSSNGMRERKCVCICVCVDGMNLKYALHWHIHISVDSVLCQCCTQAHAPLNHLRIVNRRAESGYFCCFFIFVFGFFLSETIPVVSSHSGK